MSLMPMLRRYLPDNQNLVAELLNSYENGDLILTPSKRLAHLVVRSYRSLMEKENVRGWEVPKVLSIAAWLKELSLMRDVPCVADKYLRWKLLGDICSEYPPPDPLSGGVKLARSLDVALSTLIRHNIHWCSREPESELYEWRNEVFRRFFYVIRSSDLIHSEEVPFFVKKSKFLQFYLPKRLHLLLLDTLAPSEQALIDNVTEKIEALYWGIDETNLSPHVEWKCFNEVEEEVRWVIRESMNVSHEIPLHGRGIVVMDPETVVPLFRKSFEDILGKAATDRDGSYNIAYADYLSNAGLFKASLIPLRFWLENEPRKLLISLLLSTYYGLWQGLRDEASLVDAELRKMNAHRSVFNYLKGIINRAEWADNVLPEVWLDCLERLRDFKGNCSGWFSLLDEFWEVTGFPVTGDEIDEISWRHYGDLRIKLIQALGESCLGLEEFYAWLVAAASEIPISHVGHEEAGIQVMGALDARGLFFERLWIVGLTEEAFPQPVRDIAFISPGEARGIQGCNTESQWHFASRLFPKLLAASGEIVITRHSFSDSEVVPPSPFWRGVETREEYTFWEDSRGWWVRSEVYRQALVGISKPSRWLLPPNVFPDPVPLEEISVSQLESILSCPFKFLSEMVLCLTPLDEEFIGLHPLERGSLLHKVLEKFVKYVVAHSVDLHSDEARNLLEKISRDTISKQGDSPFYDLELERWLDREKGLLTRWLEIEKKRLDNGYTWTMAEVPFSGLKLGKIELKGRIDRIDSKDDGSLMCLEYKTGMIPAAKNVFDFMTQPQLPSYLLAIKRKLAGRMGIHENSGNEPLRILAGYVSLKRAGEVEVKEYKPKNESWESFFRRWEEWVLERIDPVISGVFEASPVPSPEEIKKTPCNFCPFDLLCNQMR